MADSKGIPTLSASDVECRVQSVSKAKSGKVGAILLLYKDARVDMRILDAVYGANNWQRTHEIIGGNLFCNIDVWDDEKKCWVRKQDVGTESNTEKEKGQASDSFKRAGFNVGIGRELYTAPFIYIELNDSEYYEDQGRVKCGASTRFTVKRIGYNDRREIIELVIADRYNKDRYTLKSTQEERSVMDEHPTATQLSKLYLIAAEVGFDEEAVAKHMMKKYGCGVNAITQGQYTEALSGYMKLRTKAG